LGKPEKEFKRLEKELRKHCEQLEEFIDELTLELKDNNRKLQQEIIAIKLIESYI
jgi:hypothetical protein